MNTIEKEKDEQNVSLTHDEVIADAPKKSPKIFISHNEKDKYFSDALVEMIKALDVDEKCIFCSSFPDLGANLGENIDEKIKRQFLDFDLLVIFIHSPLFYKSRMSLIEMGAAWILNCKHYSFLTKDCDFSELNGVITSKETSYKAGEGNADSLLNQFKDDLLRIFNLKNPNIEAWSAIKKKFTDAVLIKNQTNGNKRSLGNLYER